MKQQKKQAAAAAAEEKKVPVLDKLQLEEKKQPHLAIPSARQHKESTELTARSLQSSQQQVSI